MLQGLLLMLTFQTELQVNGVIILLSCEYTILPQVNESFTFSNIKFQSKKKSNKTEDEDIIVLHEEESLLRPSTKVL